LAPGIPQHRHCVDGKIETPPLQGALDDSLGWVFDQLVINSIPQAHVPASAETKLQVHEPPQLQK
jgi:hypothetical protein